MKTATNILNAGRIRLATVSAIVAAVLPVLSSQLCAQGKPKTLQATATAVSDGLGKVLSSDPKGEKGQVFVFEEFHTSRIGQLQIALMLVRLHEQAGLKVIGLEGAIQREKPLDPAWFRGLGGPEAKSEREDVAVRMLASGELSAPEFTSLLYPDVKVYGLELKEEYDVKLKDEGNPVAVYLLGVAEKKLKQADIVKINALATQKKEKEALELIKNADPWVKEQFAAMESAKISVGEHAKRLREIKSKAEQLGVGVDAKTRAGMDNTIRFFETASKRSATMVGKLTQLLATDTRTPIAMIIGAAHSDEVEAQLKKAGIAYSLISPEALNPKEGSLTIEQFERKGAGKWAMDSLGTLGHVLNSQRKPPPVIETASGESYASAVMATTLVGRALKDGKRIPGDILDQLKGLPELRIDPASFERKDGVEEANSNVIFRMWLKTTSGQEKEVWTRVGLDPRPAVNTIEDKLRQAIVDVGGRGNQPPTAPPRGTSRADGEGPGDGKGRSQGGNEMVVQRINRDVVAIFDSSKSEAIETVRTGG